MMVQCPLCPLKGMLHPVKYGFGMSVRHKAIAFSNVCLIEIFIHIPALYNPDPFRRVRADCLQQLFHDAVGYSHTRKTLVYFSDNTMLSPPPAFGQKEADTKSSEYSSYDNSRSVRIRRYNIFENIFPTPFLLYLFCGGGATSAIIIFNTCAVRFLFL